MGLNKDIFNEVFDNAIAGNYKYIAVEIQINNNKKTELIINKRDSFKDRLEYYNKTYDDNLKHKHAAGIRIIGVAYANTLKEFEIIY